MRRALVLLFACGNPPAPAVTQPLPPPAQPTVVATAPLEAGPPPEEVIELGDAPNGEIHVRGRGAVVLDEKVMAFDHRALRATCVDSSDEAALKLTCHDPHQQTVTVSLRAPFDIVTSFDGVTSAKPLALPPGTKAVRPPESALRSMHTTDYDLRDLGPPDRCASAHGHPAVRAAFEHGSVKRDGIAYQTVFLSVPVLQVHKATDDFTEPNTRKGERTPTSVTFQVMHDNGMVTGEIVVVGDTLYAVTETRFASYVLVAPLPCGAKVTLDTITEHSP